MDWGSSEFSATRHDKSTIIYSKSTNELRAFLGGIDYDQTRMDNELHTLLPVPYPAGGIGWHDVGVEREEVQAAAVLGNFRTRWEETSTLPPERHFRDIDGNVQEFNPKIEPTKPSAGRPNLVVSGSGVRVVRNYGKVRSLALWDEENHLPWATLPAGGVQELNRVLQRVVDAATNYIYVEDQGLNSHTLTLPLPLVSITIVPVPHTVLYPKISSACARGVKVIFVCPGRSDPADNTVAPTTMSKEILDEILDPLTSAQRENFALYMVSNTVLHSKVVLVDDEFASIGSGNFWDRSLTGGDTEINVAITDPGPLVADLRSRLWRDHLRVSSSPLVEAELHDLRKSLGFFRHTWGAV